MISVCIATYNGGKYIEEQLRSILDQLSADDEVIVSDDNSTDDTVSIIKSLGDSRIKIYAHKPDKCSFLIDHSTHNFENALRHSHGDIIFLSDQDDKWTDNKVSTMIEGLSNYDMVVSDCYVTDVHLNIIEPSYFAKRKRAYGISGICFGNRLSWEAAWLSGARYWTKPCPSQNTESGTTCGLP